MKRRGFILAGIGTLLLIGWVLHGIGWLSRSGSDTASTPTDRATKAAPLKTPAGWRYRQSQPHHWRYIMLRK